MRSLIHSPLVSSERGPSRRSFPGGLTPVSPYEVEGTKCLFRFHGGEMPSSSSLLRSDLSGEVRDHQRKTVQKLESCILGLYASVDIGGLCQFHWQDSPILLLSGMAGSCHSVEGGEATGKKSLGIGQLTFLNGHLLYEHVRIGHISFEIDHMIICLMDSLSSLLRSTRPKDMNVRIYNELCQI